jgi:dipeptidyl aminopeptidase/acylaminoacyl peptidase
MIFRTLVLTLAVAASGYAQRPDYARAEQLLDWNVKKRVFGGDIQPTWMKDSTRFWYRVTTPQDANFYLVDPVANSKKLLFDNGRLAAAMSSASDTTWEPNKLPFTTFTFTDATERVIEFEARKKRYRCDIVAYTCTLHETVSDTTRIAVKSPDGKWWAFSGSNNLYIRPAAGGDSIQLTNDGEELYAYGISNVEGGMGGRSMGKRPLMQWAPNSKKIVIRREDFRKVQTMAVYSSTTNRPKIQTYAYALPGDSVIPRGNMYIIDIESRRVTPVRTTKGDTLAASTYLIPSIDDQVWSVNAEKLYITSRPRGEQSRIFHEVDAATGVARELFIDRNDAYPVRTLKNGDILVTSWKDGWSHYYLLTRDGKIKTQLTKGPFSAGGATATVDEKNQRLFLIANGREPNRFIYHTYLYRVNFDGSGFMLLTPEDGDHSISFSPNKKYFIDTYSRLDLPPITVLRSAEDGRVIRELEKADASRLADIRWTPPELFRATAADGVTDIYGYIFKPSWFDSTKTYPVVDQIYPVPTGAIRDWGFNTGDYLQPRALAELGFIVVQIQPRGTMYRSRAFLDAYQGHMGQNTLPDHVTAIQQLGARFRWMDMTKIGIYGLSGGGFASTAGILRYPDFYKVAVSMAGNHDNRTYGYYWGEDFQGLFKVDPKTGKDNYEEKANYTLANNLKGHLFLIHGDMDDNVHPAHTLRVAHALIAAKKDFDMLIMPDRGHAVYEPYVIKKSWDYFVRHLMGVEPQPYVMSDK